LARIELKPRVVATDDFEIFEGDRRAGCIYKITLPTSVRWHWHVYTRGRDGAQFGTSGTLSEAVGAFCNAFDAQSK
jgi:hypothetical protein